MTAFIEDFRKLMGWCPVADTKINEPPSEESYANKSDSSKPDSGASGKLFGTLFEWDYIVKEELLRSIAFQENGTWISPRFHYIRVKLPLSS